jgi:uncharacterized membrane protein YhiD involved in acid resistance
MPPFFQNPWLQTLTLGTFVLNLGVAFACSLLHIWFYRATYRGPGYSVSFLNGLVLLSSITAMVIMVIGDSLARAFGLIGAMSIIRFRTAVKDVLDIVHIFLALVIGMAAGVGLHAAALAGTGIVGAIYFLLVRFNVVSPDREQFVIQFAFDPPAGGKETADPAYLRVLKKHCKSSKLVNVKSTGENGEMEVSFYVKLRHDSRITDLVHEIKAVRGVHSVVMFSDEESF